MSKKKEIRRKFRGSVLKRDGYTCRICEYEPKELSELDAHHITDRSEMPNGGYVKENGITLCNTGNNCHLKAELFHITQGEKWEDGMHPDDIYKLIGSTYKEACGASQNIE